MQCLLLLLRDSVHVTLQATTKYSLAELSQQTASLFMFEALLFGSL